MFKIIKACLTIAVPILAGVLAAGGAAVAQAPKQIGVFNDWAAFEVTEKDGKACYAASAPQDRKPADVKRGDVWTIVTHRPWKAVRSELSIYSGYPYKAGSKVTVVVDGGKSFELYTHEETAWAQNAGEDVQIAEAMRAGNAMVISGTSARGTVTTDRYSLSGFTAAHKAIDAACPKK
jgi:hypothetical protein